MDLSDVDALQQALSELKLRIDREANDVVEQAMPSPPPEQEVWSATEPSEDIDLVNKLWILKAGFQETNSLVELENVEAAFHSLLRLDSKIEEFNASFPHTLLGIDMIRQAAEIRSKLREFVAQRWEDMVEVTDNKIRFREDEKGNEIAALYPHKDVMIGTLGILLDQVLDLEVTEVNKDDGIRFVKGPQKSLDAFVAVLKSVTTYLATAPPPELVNAIIRRYKSHLVTGILHRSIPKLYPTELNALPAFKQQLQGLLELESELSKHLWVQGTEISRFVSSFDDHWPTVRRGQFLARLRRLYKEAAPLRTVESRRKIVKPPTEVPEDEWEWNDEDVSEEDNATDGMVVELWREYADELGIQDSDQFFTLYRAIVPTVYGSHSLWLYADTLSFVQHAGDRAQDALSPFAYLYLDNYVRNHAAILEAELLPQIFGAKQNKALNQLKTHIGNVAEESNAEGGPELRESVLGQLVEQIAVYVVNSIEALDDIGDEESSKLASMIAKLENLAVFFRDVKLSVPSWFKLEMVGRILMSNLATIEEMHSQHQLADFSASELEGLLRALFIDSAARQALIREFYNAER